MIDRRALIVDRARLHLLQPLPDVLAVHLGNLFVHILVPAVVFLLGTVNVGMAKAGEANDRLWQLLSD